MFQSRTPLRPETFRPFRRALLDWYDRNKRPLPWRNTRDGYATWVAETMLQQTRTEVVGPRWAEFLERFPTVEALARAEESAVLAAWSGLGYYRRARSLHAAARLVCEQGDGRLPETADELRLLPGIGRYTAGAIASIAFGQAVPLVDGNVSRVFARLLCLADPAPSPALERASWELAGKLLVNSRPGDWNQSLMELGATVCTPRSPLCGQCPVARWCAAAACGEAEAFPRRAKKRATEQVRKVVAVVKNRRGEVLLVKTPGEPVLQDLWQLPSVDLEATTEAVAALRDHLANLGVECRTLTFARSLRHAITYRRIRAEVFTTNLQGRSPRSSKTLRWASLAEMPDLALGSIELRVLEVVISRQ